MGPGDAVRVRAIDQLRGVAVLAVLLHHAPMGWSGAPSPPHWLRDVTAFGRYGVNLFLVISGFCIHMAWARQRDISARPAYASFWRRRLRRLYPPYAAAIALTAGCVMSTALLWGGPLVGIASWFGYESRRLLLTDIVVMLLLLQNLTLAAFRFGNGAFWTLALEEQLYALYFPFLGLRRRWGLAAALGLTASVAIVWRLVNVRAQMPEWWDFVGPARWMEWVLGAVAVERFVAARERASSAAVAVAIAVVAGAILLDPYAGLLPVAATGMLSRRALQDSLVGIACFVVVDVSCRRGLGSPRRSHAAGGLLAHLGTVSYSLYLVHGPVMNLALRAANACGVRSVIALLAARIGASLVVAEVFHRFVEVRFLTRRSPSQVVLS
jgi:peptidoglycan/LPS O-acetylase OafA/YrhL